MRNFLIFGLLIGLLGCAEMAPAPSDPPRQETVAVQQTSLSAKAGRMFLAVVARVEPVAERECRARATGVNCNFHVVVAKNARLPPNAFQTFEKNGQPIIVFTQALIADVRNADELAFILGHEAGHLIRGHISRTQQQAQTGAIFGGVMAAVLGLDEGGVEEAMKIGGAVGARRFSKNFELEADEMGAIIATHAGYNAIEGAQYFLRIPDPGDKFLGSHPANLDRIKIVRQTIANM